jgi:hypothetical protein
MTSCVIFCLRLSAFSPTTSPTLALCASYSRSAPARMTLCVLARVCIVLLAVQRRCGSTRCRVDSSRSVTPTLSPRAAIVWVCPWFPPPSMGTLRAAAAAVTPAPRTMPWRAYICRACAACAMTGSSRPCASHSAMQVSRACWSLRVAPTYLANPAAPGCAAPDRGFELVPFSVKTYGRVGEPAMRCPQSAAD